MVNYFIWDSVWEKVTKKVNKMNQGERIHIWFSTIRVAFFYFKWYIVTF